MQQKEIIRDTGWGSGWSKVAGVVTVVSRVLQWSGVLITCWNLLNFHFNRGVILGI